MNKDCLCGNPECQIPYGFCHCGCGEKTAIAPRNEFRRGWVKNEPIIYIRGHASDRRNDRHLLTDIDVKNRRAVCDRCGQVSIKKNGGGNGWVCTGALNLQHRLTEINTENQRGWCRGCLAEVDIVLVDKARNRWVCAVIRRIHQEADRVNNREARATTHREWYRKNGRNWTLQNKYGITQTDYETMFANQNGVCWVCGGPPDFYGRLVVDHHHDTGVNRGLLCNRCNRVLGMIKENPDILQSLLYYLQHWNSQLIP